MVITAGAKLLRDEIGCQLAVRRGNLEQLCAEDALGSAALVGVDVCGLRADDRLVPAQQQAEPENVRRAPVEHQEHVALRAKETAQLRRGTLSPPIGPVRDRVTRVRFDDRVQDRRMGARMIVTSETSALSHGQ
jgi:hypothetical protein